MSMNTPSYNKLVELIQLVSQNHQMEIGRAHV